MKLFGKKNNLKKNMDFENRENGVYKSQTFLE